MVGKNRDIGTGPHRSPVEVGIIGYGAIGQVVADAITDGRAGNTALAAMLALSTAGMDSTKVKLVPDPTSMQMRTLIRFEGVAGNLHIEWHGVPSKINPSTSADVPLAVIKAIRNLTSTVCYGV